VALINCSRETILRANTVRANLKSGVQLSEGTDALLEENEIKEGRGSGVYIYEDARGLLRRNQIVGNVGIGVRIEESAPRLEHNVVSSGGDVGISVSGLTSAQRPTSGDKDITSAAAGDESPTGGDSGERPSVIVQPEGDVARSSEAGVKDLVDQDVSDRKGIGSKESYGEPTAELSVQKAYEVSKMLGAPSADEAVEADVCWLIAQAMSQATIVNNEVHGNAKSGVQFKGGACPLLEGNVIRDGQAAALLVCGGARGVVRNNHLSGHVKTELQLSDAGTSPLVERNIIHSSSSGGVLAFSNAGGLLRRNEVHGNHKANVRLSERSCTRLEDNTIRNGKDCGLAISSGCTSVVVGNDIRENVKANVLMWGAETKPTLVANKIHHGLQSGVYMYAAAGCNLIRNEIWQNAGPGVLVTEASEPLLRQNMIRDGEDYGVLIHEDGRGTLECNNVHSNRTYGIACLTGASPIVKYNWIHGRRQGGVLVDQGGAGEFEYNEIEMNQKSGITLRGASGPAFRYNRIHDGADSGIHAMHGAGGIIEENLIFKNEHAGIAVETGASPIIKNNKIYDGKQGGVFFFENGRGTMSGNEVWDNEDFGLQIIEDGDPTVHDNIFRQQAESKLGTPPVWIHSAGRGTVQDNEVVDSHWHGMVIGQLAQPLVQGNKIHACTKSGVLCQDGCIPTLIENEIFKNYVGVECMDDAEPILRGNKIHHQKMGAIWVYKESKGLYEENELYNNGKAAIRVWDHGDPICKGNKIWGGKSVGLLIYEFGRGHYVNNDISANRSWNIEVKRMAFPLIEGNTIRDSKYGGVYAHGGGGVHMESEVVRFKLIDNDIYNNTGIGVSIGKDANPLVEKNKIHDGHTAGVYVMGDNSKGRVHNNEIYRNRDGVVIREGGAPIIDKNTIYEQTRRGVLVCEKGQGSVVENTIRDNLGNNVEVRGEIPDGEKTAEEEENELNLKKKAYASMGMLVPLSTDGVTIAGLLTDESGATTLTLRLNNISGGKGDSVAFCDYAKGFVKENTIERASRYGLLVGLGADPDVVGNLFSHNRVNAIRVQPSGSGRYQNNKITNSGNAGVVVEEKSDPDLRGNSIKDNGEQGVHVLSNAKGRLSANTVEGNSRAGIELESGSAPQLRGNFVQDNTGPGIIVRNTSAALLVSNDIQGNGTNGLVLTEGANPIVEKNGIRENRDHGVHVLQGAKGRLMRNMIERNGKAGVIAELGCAPILGENFVQHNEEDEVVVPESSQPTGLSDELAALDIDDDMPYIEDED